MSRQTGLMPRHEPSQRAEPGELLAGKVVMRRGPDGKVEIVPPEPPEAEPAEEPPSTPSSNAP